MRSSSTDWQPWLGYIFLSSYQMPEKNMLFPFWRQMEIFIYWSTMQHNSLWEQLPLQSIWINLFRKKKVSYTVHLLVFYEHGIFLFCSTCPESELPFHDTYFIAKQDIYVWVTTYPVAVRFFYITFFFSCASLSVHACLFLCYFMFFFKSSPIHHVS